VLDPVTSSKRDIHMKLHLFANRIQRVYFSGGAVTIEFAVIPPDEKGEVSPDTVVTDNDIPYAISLPLAGYMRSVAEMRRFTEEMQKKGVLKKPEGGEKSDRMRRQTELQDITSDGPGDEPLI